MRQCTERRMAVHNLNALAQQNVSQQRDIAHHGWQNALIVERADWQVVDFEAFSQVTHSLSTLVRMCDDDDLQEKHRNRMITQLSTHCDVSRYSHHVLWPANIATN